MSKLVSIVIFLTYFLSSCAFDNSSKKMTSAYIGIYQIDIDKSLLGLYKKDAMTFKNLTLTISSDSSFSFNTDLPFIRNQKGKWKIKSIDGIDFLYLIYGEGSYSIIEDEVNLTVEKNIYISNTRPKIDKENVQKLFLNRIE